MHGIGGHRELIGRRVGAPVHGSVRATIHGADAFHSVDLRSGFVPALVTGKISGPGTPGSRDIAVAVNGRIVATAPTFVLANSSTENFSALVPEASLRNGANRVQILWVRGPSAAPELAQIGEAP